MWNLINKLYDTVLFPISFLNFVTDNIALCSPSSGCNIIKLEISLSLVYHVSKAVCLYIILNCVGFIFFASRFFH